jgi:ribose transport system permease protein
MNPRLVRSILENRIYLIFAVAFVLALVLVPDLRSVPALKNVVVRSSIDGLLAVGLTVVIIAGQLDLSVGSTLALSGVVALGLQGDIGAWPAAIVGVLAGVGVGIINGLLVTRGGINSFIATLATMIAIRGVAFTLSDSQPIRGADAAFGPSVDRAIFGPLVNQLGTFITPRVVIFLGALLIANFVLKRVRTGRNVYALGGNVEAARLSGIDVDRYTMGAFVFSGFMAGLAGVVLGLSLNTGSPIVGSNSVLTVIAAVVIGGASLSGGTGSMLKTLAGVLLLGLVNTSMNMNSVEIYVQFIVTGVILVTVILIDSLYSARRARPVATRAPGTTQAS